MNGDRIVAAQAAFKGACYHAKDYFSLFKIQLCLYISLSALLGQVTAARYFSLDSLFLGFFVLILASGAAVLNNVQDRQYDLFFKRTCNRSLPQKKIPLSHAKAICLTMIGCGLSCLLVFRGPVPFFWGTMALLCYNGLYTPLKKISLLAIIPGSLSGMLPPLIGWTAAGGSATAPDILILMAVFGLWQVPHFLIILLKNRPHQSQNKDVNKFPCFTTLFSCNELKLQILIWTALFSLSILLFLMNGAINNPVLSLFSGLNAIFISFIILLIWLKNNRHNRICAFFAINLSMLFFMGAGICDKLICFAPPYGLWLFH